MLQIGLQFCCVIALYITCTVIHFPPCPPNTSQWRCGALLYLRPCRCYLTFNCPLIIDLGCPAVSCNCLARRLPLSPWIESPSASIAPVVPVRFRRARVMARIYTSPHGCLAMLVWQVSTWASIQVVLAPTGRDKQCHMRQVAEVAATPRREWGCKLVGKARAWGQVPLQSLLSTF